MKRGWNIRVWVGFLIVLSALLTYPLVFARFPITRDLPWATLLMFAAGFTVMIAGLWRAYREPHLYRGRLLDATLALLGLAVFAFFVSGAFYFARRLPPSKGAPQVGGKAPDFTLPDQDGNLVTLSELLESGPNGGGSPGGIVLIFYRGHW